LLSQRGENGNHVTQNDVGWLAVNKGIHKLGENLIYVDTIKTDKIQGKNIDKYSNNGRE